MIVKDFKERFINKIVRVTTRNQRVFYGRLVAVDDKANVLLYETAAQIPQHLTHPVNLTLTNVLDDELRSHKYIDTSGLSQQQSHKLISEFPRNKYYFGPVMITQSDILKIEIQRKVMDEVRKPVEASEKPNQSPNESLKSLAVDQTKSQEKFIEQSKSS